MPKTIYCTFDDSDIADIAMGSLRRSGLSINSIDNVGDLEHITPGKEPDALSQMDILPLADGNILLPGLMPAFSDGEEGTGVADALPGGHPATFKINCADNACQEIIAKLINFGAHRVRYY